MQTLLLILNNTPYGKETSYQALRLAINLLEQEQKSIQLRIFMLGDGVYCAIAGQNPTHHDSIEQMVDILCMQGAYIHLCKTCIEARGITSHQLIEGISLSTLHDLTQWTLMADKVLNF